MTLFARDLRPRHEVVTSLPLDRAIGQAGPTPSRSLLFGGFRLWSEPLSIATVEVLMECDQVDHPAPEGVPS